MGTAVSLGHRRAGHRAPSGSKIGSLVARAYPRSPRDALVILTDWHTWLFMLDDECDEAGIGKRPQRLTALQPSACKANFTPAI